MLRKQFCFCRCYYEKNLYLKEYGTHFMFKNSAQFMKDYFKILNSKAYDEIKLIEEKLKDEIKRRKEWVTDSVSRRKIIKENYSPLHPSIFTLSESFLDSTFLKICESVNNGSATNEESLEHVEKHNGRLFSLPVFSDQFCNKLIDELKNFENSSLPKQRPNTMNRYGVNLDELGFEPFITELRTKYLRPLTHLLFPDWGGGSLDSHKAFIVLYKKGEDEELSYHYDNAEVTLNVSLNSNFIDGDLFFGPMRFEDSSSRFGYEHAKGNGMLHRGQQMHGAFPITEGERYNLIIWMRSSEVRNQLCPMCDEVPDLEPVQEGTGDGFTITVHDLCTMN